MGYRTWDMRCWIPKNWKGVDMISDSDIDQPFHSAKAEYRALLPHHRSLHRDISQFFFSFHCPRWVV
jgi:hypothetical protein